MASTRSTGPILRPFSREYRWSSFGFGHICTMRGKPNVKMEDYRDTVWSQLVDRSHLGHLLHFSSITREFPSISQAFSSVLLAPMGLDCSGQHRKVQTTCEHQFRNSLRDPFSDTVYCIWVDERSNVERRWSGLGSLCHHFSRIGNKIGK